MTDREAFLAWWPLKLCHFSPEEFLVHTEKPLNSVPPSVLWPNIIATAIVLDELRERLRTPLRITSCYRNSTYNRKIGGTRLSNHQSFTATDFIARGDRPRGSKAHMQALSYEGLLAMRQEAKLFCAPWRIGLRSPVYIGMSEVPFKEFDLWKREFSFNERYVFAFAGGLGRYSAFTHLDTRGINHTWSGA